MTVSVVIPLYNKARHIRRAVDSVLAQAYQDFELIVVDDGSTDAGGDVVREMTDLRIRLITQENAGEGAARNRGIKEAACDLVAFLDADDEWLPCFLETVMRLHTRHPDAGMYATAYRCTQGLVTWRPGFTDCVASLDGGLLNDYFRAAMGPQPVQPSAVMIPKHVFEDVGGFPVGVRLGGDLHTWARIALRYRVAWSLVDGAVYHLSADNRACNLYSPAADIAAASVIEEFLRSGREPVSSRRMVEEYLVSRRLPLALESYLQGNRAWALGLLAKTRGTTMFRSRWMFLQCIVWFPPAVLRAAMTAKASLRRQLGMICQKCL
ncbi:MAG: glycosyltransferase family A protein [Verrucomicrobia bacterium]|nr:glycosyltransferase family A protein [Verrucomicrobiota bacterium]